MSPTIKANGNGVTVSTAGYASTYVYLRARTLEDVLPAIEEARALLDVVEANVRETGSPE